VRSYETSPPTYFLFLDVWAHVVGSHGEVAARLPSALGGAGVVVSVWYFARMLAGDAAGAIAGLLALCSPLVLQYAQQARMYTFVMLFATLAAIAAVRAARTGSSRWLAGSCGLAIIAVSFHYVAWLVAVPMWIWLMQNGRLAARRKRLSTIALVAIGALWAPVALAEFSRFPNGGIGVNGALTVRHAMHVVAAPFNGRSVAPTALAEPLAIVILLVCAARVESLRRDRSDREPDLILGMALVPITALLLLGVAGRDLVITRYATVAAPFMIALIAVAIASVPSLAIRVAGGAIVLTIAVAGAIRSFDSSHFYPNGRGLMRYVAAHWRPTDAVVYNGMGDPDNLLTPTAFYARRYLPAGFETVIAPPFATRQFGRLQASSRRLWIVNETGPHAPTGPAMPAGYRIAQSTTFNAAMGLRVLLAVPG